MKSPYGRASAHYPKHLHLTHLIPSIKQREKGVKPVPKEDLKKNPDGVAYNPFVSSSTGV